MTGPLREQWQRIVGFVRGRRAEGDLDAEVETHIAMAIDDYVRRGMSEPEARRLAAMQYGSRLSAKEHASDQRGLPGLESFFTDVRYAARMMRTHPGFTAAAVLTMALGIGANGAVFAVTNAVLFKGFRSIDRNDRLLYISSYPQCCVSYPDFADWRADARSFEDIGAVADLQITLRDEGGSPETYNATLVSANAFGLLGQKPLLGRDFSPADENPGAAPVAILSYGFWERHYGKEPDIIGRIVRINAIPTTVIGVMKRGVAFPKNQDIWMPLVATPDRQLREARGLWFAFGRLAEGVTVEQARAEMEVIGRRLAREYPLTNAGPLPVVQSFHQFFVGPDAPAIYGSLWGAVGFVLLIACANLANLLLARAMTRSREISVRIALGAGRWRIVRQLLIESVMLSGLGGVAGWWLAAWSVHAYELAAVPPTMSWSNNLLDYSLDYRVFAYLITMAIGTGLLFGLAPALKLSTLDIHTALKDGGHRAAGGGRGKRASALLVAGEIALAVVLLAGAGVMLRSFWNLYTADAGIRTDHVVAMLLNLPDSRYPDPEAQRSFFDRLETRLGTRAELDSVAVADSLPGSNGRQLPYELAGAAASVDAQRRPRVTALAISPAYFRTLGVSVIAGREFTSADGASGVPAVIVNQRFASQHWPGEDPLGHHLRLLSGKTPGEWLTVVGVAPDIGHAGGPGQQRDPAVYLPYRQAPAQSMWVLARARVPPGHLGTPFRRDVHALDPELPIWLGPFPLAERLAANYWNNGLYGTLLVIFAAIALLLASIGLYAVVAHSVSQRTQEFGIRMAIGATARDILTLVFGQGMRPVGAGLTIGLAGALAATPLLKSQLVGVSPADPITLAVAFATLLAAATLGCLIPARRAMRVDPLVALRHD